MQNKLLVFVLSITLTSLSSCGQTNLDSSNGFDRFNYGTSIKQHKDFKLKPTAEVFQEYISTVSFNYKGVKIDSVDLFFYKDKLYTIELYINQSQLEKMANVLETIYGPKSALLSETNEYNWNGKKVKLSIYSVGNMKFVVHFEKLENRNEREMETIKSIMK